MPEPVVVMFPAPLMLPVSVNISPEGNSIPSFAVIFPDTINVPPTVVDDVLLPIFTRCAPDVLVFRFKVVVPVVVPTCPILIDPPELAPPPILIGAVLLPPFPMLIAPPLPPVVRLLATPILSIPVV